MKVEGEEPVHLRHDDPSVDVDPGVEGEPLYDGAEDRVGQQEDDQPFDNPDQTEDRDVGQGVQFQNVERLQIIAVFSVHLDSYSTVQSPQNKDQDQT